VTSLKLKDWKNPSDYTNQEQSEGWAWEFLRRNPDYQKDYQRLDSFPNIHEIYGNKNGKWKGTPWEGMRFYIDGFFYTDPPATEGETLEDYFDRNPRANPPMPYADYMCGRYHIEPRPFDPGREYEEIEFLSFSDYSDEVGFDTNSPPWEMNIHIPKLNGGVGSLEYQWWLERMVAYFERENLMVIGFDLTGSIDRQVAIAKQMLMDERESSRRHIGDKAVVKSKNLAMNKYSNYIRILDALSVGATRQEIAEVIYPHQFNTDTNHLKNKIRRNIDSAKQLRDKDYWRISGGY